MSGASISCSHETRSWVKTYMTTHHLDSYDAALQHMRVALEGRGQQGVAKKPERAPSPVKKKKKEKQPRKQLMTWEDVSGNSEVMTYLTGLVEDARGWLIPKLVDQVTRGGKKMMLCSQ